MSMATTVLKAEQYSVVNIKWKWDTDGDEELFDSLPEEIVLPLQFASAAEGDLYIRGYYSLTDKFDLVSLGTIKTLFTDKESIRQMAALYGECLIAYEEIMNNELDKFTRKGYDLFLVDEEGEIRHCLSGLSSKEKETERFKLCSVRYRKGVVRDNLTRKEFVLSK